MKFFRKIQFFGNEYKPLKNLKHNFLEMKLSKTNDKGTINLSDSSDIIKKKFRKATTDFIFDDIFYCESRREVNNLM